MGEEAEKAKKVAVGGRGLVDTFHHSLDPKRRLTIPSEWRDAMGQPDYVYIFPDVDEDCLNLVPAREMEAFFGDLGQHDIFDTAIDRDAEALAQSAQMLRVDTAGRIRIGDALLAFAGITDKVTLVGAFRKAKIRAGGDEEPETKKGIDVAAFRAAVARRRAARGEKA